MPQALRNGLALDMTAFLTATWKDFLQDSSKVGENTLWVNATTLAKYNDQYLAFAKAEGGCTFR
jgi:hypothetical protein